MNKLFIPSPIIDKSHEFENDIFNRKPLAELLNGYIDRLTDGCVIGIDAPWGEGKSWFCKNWYYSLYNFDKQKTVYIDAFQNDYIEDPFLLICGELIGLLTEDEKIEKRDLVEAGKAVGRALLPIATKLAVNAVGKIVLGTSDCDEKIAEIIENGFNTAIDKKLEKLLANRKSDKEILDNFKDKLKTVAAKQEKPIVVFVDELDRCKPTFAVQFIERIKHFFDIPNIVFVLFLNRLQLEGAIKGTYGDEIDAKAYLGKFIQLFLQLPKKIRIGDATQGTNYLFCEELSKRYSISGEMLMGGFVDVLSFFADTFELSLRDLEHAFILYNLVAHPNRAGGALEWLIVLKIMHSEIYKKILQNSTDGHIEALDKFNEKKNLNISSDLRRRIEGLHLIAAHRGNGDDYPEIKNLSLSIKISPDKLMTFFARLIDLPLVS